MAGYVRQSIPSSGLPEQSSSTGIATRLGLEAMMDFFMYSALVGAAYQIRAGTITTPVVGDVALTDTAAEMCVDAPSALLTIIPVNLNISLRLLTGTLHEYAVKSVAGASTVGAAFAPLQLKSSGPAATATARVANNGGVTVPAEAVTTTRRHWSFANPAAGATGALPTAGYDLQWNPRVPPVLTGPWVIYTQIAATGTGPSYYAAFEWLEFPTAALL